MSNKEQLQSNNALLLEQIERVKNLSAGNNIKLFETQEEMQADTTAKEEDLAVVYRSEIQNMTSDSEVTQLTFPETVTLPSAYTDSCYTMIRAVDSSVMFDGNCMLSQNSFRFDGWSDSGMIRVEYTSTDGITYTRTRMQGDSGDLENPVELPTACKVENTDEWDDNLSYFMQTGGKYFEGLFQYSSYKDTTKIKLPLMSGLNIQYNSSSSTISSVTFDKEFSDEINFTKLVSVYNKFISDTSTPSKAYIYLDNNNNLKFVQNCNMLCYDKNVNFLGVSVTISTETDTTAKIYNIDLENETYTLDTELEPSGYIYYSSSYNWNYYDLDNKTIPFNIVNSKPTNFNYICIGDTASSKTSYTKYMEGNNCYIDTSSYLIAPTQLTTVPNDVYKSIFYSKNGVETGTLTDNIDNSFADSNAQIYSIIQTAYDNMEPRVLTDDDKTINKDTYIIPAKLDGTPLIDTSNITSTDSMFAGNSNLLAISQIDTSKVTNMTKMFSGCKALKTIPLLDTSNVTNTSYMFNACSSLNTIPQLDTSKVTNMDSMFCSCTSLESIPLFNTSNVTNMSSIVSGCKALKTIPLLDTSKVTDIGSMFYGCNNLETIPLLDTSNAIIMYQSFSFCTSLKTIPLFNTSNVTNMNYLFNNCTSLTTIPELNTSKVTSMINMFYNCTSLTTIPSLDTSKVTDMSSIVSGCKALKTIPLLDTSKVTDMSYMFNGCTSLSDESLNNILAMCANAISYNSTKTLKYIGLTSDQADKCKTLSNYSAFTSAGWTTGY